METRRLRLVFEDRHILSKSQKSNGLKRSWLQLKPNHETISDLSSYLIHFFDLHRSCPNGLLLSMDGFVLPPFESTCILKDNDIVCVKKKGVKLSDIIKADDMGEPIEEGEIVDKQPVIKGVPLLANEEVEKETGGYQTEAEDDEDHHSEDTVPAENSLGGDTTSKKRKATKKLQNSARKKRRPMPSEAVENDVPRREIESLQNEPMKNLHKKEKVANVNNKPDRTRSLESSEKNGNIVDTTPSAKRCHQLQEKGTCNLDGPHKPDEIIKSPSRSARRKKAKRQWLRESLKTRSKELNERPSAAEDMHKKSVPEKGPMTNFPNQDNDGENEVVPVVNRPGHIRFDPDEEGPNHSYPLSSPVVIRPGHIRFEYSGEDNAVQQNQVPVETFQWNGITSKKKGQKWGKENSSFCRRNDYKDVNNEYGDIPTLEKETTVNDPIDFEKLAPLTTFPKEGDVIAYRLLELSLSWTPELSSFRVGKTSTYDPESNTVVLMPVPEFPIVFEKVDDDDEDESSEHQDNSLYREDGSLEIDFSSLVDVRVVEYGNLGPAKEVPTRVNEAPMGNGELPQNGEKQTHIPTPEKEVNVWVEISEVLSAKKAELSQENGSIKENSGRSSWSFRALRGSALGPTMALLRSRNDI